MTHLSFPRIALFLALTHIAAACDVPVFRYALERWESDPFPLVVFQHGPLNPALEQKLRALEPVPDERKPHANWKVTSVDVDKPLPALWSGLWQSLPHDAMPCAAVCTPEWRKGDPALWSGALDDKAIKLLTLSPKRQEMVAHLLKGTAVVWLVVETQDQAASEKLIKLLNEQSARLLGEITIAAGGGRGSPDVRSPLPIEVSFAMVRVKHDDPAEQVLLRLLTNGEPVKEPMLYPVFGRARALAAMKASAVDPDLVEETARFICGACSCQVKAQNPGFDLLLQADWDSIFGDQEPPPPETQPRRPTPIYVPIPQGKKK